MFLNNQTKKKSLWEKYITLLYHYIIIRYIVKLYKVLFFKRTNCNGKDAFYFWNLYNIMTTIQQ